MARSAVFRVPLSRPSAFPVQVNYATVPGTAIPPDDFTPVSGTIVFNPGEIVKQVIVPVRDDIPGSIAEQFSLALSAPVACSIRRDTAICVLSETPVDSEPSIVIDNPVVPSL